MPVSKKTKKRLKTYRKFEIVITDELGKFFTKEFDTEKEAKLFLKNYKKTKKDK